MVGMDERAPVKAVDDLELERTSGEPNQVRIIAG